MENANPISVRPPAVTPVVSTASTGGTATPDPTVQDAERAAQYRLIIEEGPAKGTFVYKTLDSVTGEVINQFPREEVVKLSAAATYVKGMVADTKI